ncbi:hypothetical protein QTP88_009828 [Uroleucon formosanum]
MRIPQKGSNLPRTSNYRRRCKTRPSKSGMRSELSGSKKTLKRSNLFLGYPDITDDSLLRPNRKSLTTLLKKDVPYRWSALCQQFFETLKNGLIQFPILQYPDFTKPFNLTCDANNYTIGCVLSQGPIGKDLPIAYALRTLNKAEINYNTTEKELSSIVWGIKDPGSRLTRWQLKLEEYQYTIQHKPGASNTNADALSRIHRVVTRSQQNTDSIQDIENQVIPSEINKSFSETRPELP